MNRLIFYLSRSRAFTLALTGTYLSFIILCHRRVSNVFDWLRDNYSFRLYNDTTLYLSIIFLILFSAFIYTKLRREREKLKKSILWGYTLLLVLLSYYIFITVNIEVIHYIQYALLALPVFALVQRYGETVLWVTLLGAFDEAYQYFVLYTDNNTVYLDFNDMILNLIGAGIGVALIFTFLDVKTKFPLPVRPGGRNWYKPAIMTVGLTVSLLFPGLYSTGLVRSHPGEDATGAFIVLSRRPAAPQFWTVPEKSRPFHVLTPVEGISILALLLGSYAVMDFRNSPVPAIGRSFFKRVKHGGNSQDSGR